MSKRVWLPFALWSLLLGSGARTGWAYKRIVEVQDRLAKPIWGTVVGLGSYAPDAEDADSGLQLTAGLRYLRPDRDGDTWHSVGYELTANTFSSSVEDIVSYDGGVYFFYPRGEVFSFDYHWFFGAGAGIANRTAATEPEQTVGYGFFGGGLQGRVRDFYLEAKLKLVQSAPSATVAVDGSTLMLTGTYYFLP